MADEMFRAPIHRGMRVLDRARFRRTVPLKAARIFDNKNIFNIRSELERSKDAIQQDRLGSVHPDPDPDRANAGKKCILLRPEVAKTNATSDGESNGHQPQLNGHGNTWRHSAVLADMEKRDLVSIIPFNLELSYDFWTYHDIMSSILPEDKQGEIPSGFSQVGHVAHLNLRNEYLKYRFLIAEILMDKNPGVRTVINKIDDVGEENEYRTFKYEVLAGPDDMDVTVSEESCIFKFDYSKVYWNTRLNSEHRRLVSLFAEGEAVCDVMAGVGPFAVPAGKKGVFVWANDLNPDSYSSLTDAINRNKVSKFVQPFNRDGHHFIKTAAAELACTEYFVDITNNPSKTKSSAKPMIVRTLKQPKIFQHFVLNLPASALTFLPSFFGLYPASVRQQLPTLFELPLVHVYCFGTKSDNNVEVSIKICEEISGQLSTEMRPGKIDDGAVEIFDVRDVAPKKRMFCASFRLPGEVAFREAP